jgi:hypothetical protein
MLQKQSFLVLPFQPKVLACCSAIPTSKARWKASIINFKELPEGIAGVIPMIFVFSG